MTTNTKSSQRNKRHARIRARVQGTATKPRLAVYRSNRVVYAQLIDDTVARTLSAADSRSVPNGTLSEQATAVGKMIAEAATKAGTSQAVFDRGGFRYHGVVKAVAEAARENGLTL